MKRLLLSALLCNVLTGCVSLAPDYDRPDAPVPSEIDTTASGTSSTGTSPVVTADATPVPELDWRTVFVDARLQQVIALALDNNRDLRIALLNIEADRAQYRIQRAELLPSVDAGASMTAARTSADLSSTGEAYTSRSYAVDVGVSAWELDLFGRLRSLKNEALETYLATEQTQRSTRLSLLAEVATQWLTLATDEQLLVLAQRTLDSQRESLRLTDALHEQGISSGLELAQIRSSVESARGDVASYTEIVAQDRNALDLLVGTRVPATLLPQAGDLDASIALAPLPDRIPSEALLQRPDVLAAEHALRAANADIGAARAAFFPSISLTASAGYASDELDGLFASGNRTWSFAPSISLPIFHAGALKSSLDLSKIQKDIEVASYEQSIQTAFSEVADALATRANLGERLDAQRALVAATRRAYDLADARYRNGVDSYLDALDSQRSLYTAEQAEISLRLTDAANRITLFKVLGGGADAQSSDVAGRADAE